MALPVIGLVGEIIKGGLGYFKDRQNLKHQQKVQVLTQTVDWETRALETSGWKDEVWTGTLVAPIWVIVCGNLFGYPDIANNMMDSLRQLEDTPLWFQGAMGVAVSAAFGAKGVKLWQAGKEKQRKAG
jgi:hypothetical protein|tara:strand:+ start:22559 stop:22942 length:384 start_codon:yes stop_codon:yes gene_type:complete